jgi:hypothetical protein
LSARIAALARSLVKRPCHAVLDHVYRSSDRVCGYRHAAGHRFEIDDAESFRPTRENHNVGGRHVSRQILAEAQTHIQRRRVL